MIPWRVICLCAQWCGACREYRAIFDTVAAAHPGVAFDWIDVEDEAEAMGDVDVETFPTLMLACGDEVRFLGPVPPGEGQLERLVTSQLDEPAATGVQSVEATELLRRLLATVLTYHSPDSRTR